MTSQSLFEISSDTEEVQDTEVETTRVALDQSPRKEITKDEDSPSEKKEDAANNCSSGKQTCRKRNSRSCMIPSNWAHRGRSTPDRLSILRSVVDKAVADHKIFSMVGAFPSVRDALKQRGWLEKRSTNRPFKKKKIVLHAPTPASYDASDLSLASSSSGSVASTTEESDEALIARLLRQSSVDLFWSIRDSIEWNNLSKHQIVNRFPRAYFTSKVGLCSYMQQMHWYCEVGVSDILFPRCYTISHGDELAAFKYDFHITACLSLLKWLVSSYEAGGEEAVQSDEGRVPTNMLEFAMSRCNEFISKQAHEDIDREDFLTVWEHQWDQFLTCYYLIIHDNHLLHDTGETQIQDMNTKAKDVLSRAEDYWPQLELDGILNIWIVKPGNKSRGRGIKLMNKLEDILARVNPNISKESRYVVQKYIERPLLIHNTKFDIRQWFLVTCADPLTIWMYKESYLRFCSQSFSLQNMHESIHLCNNAVQTKYKNGRRDSPDLPDENMWDCYTFKTYLRTIGHADMWESRIYPGMREGIIGTLLASQEHMDRRNNCFELFGADFMLTEDFFPWLIEINSCPDMSSSTSVTARMCAQCLEDVVKVVVDRRHNKRACTGMFELAYKQQIPPAPPYLGMSLAVRGKKICKDNKNRKKSTRREDSEDDQSSTSSQSESKEGGKRRPGDSDQAVSDYEESSEEEEETKAKSHSHNREKNGVANRKHKKGPRRTLKTSCKKVKERKACQEPVKLQSVVDSQVAVAEEVKSGTVCSSDPTEDREQRASEQLVSQELSKTSKTWLNPIDVDERAKSPLDIDHLLSKPVLAQASYAETKDEDESYAYRQSLNKTKASCIELLAKLKLFRQNDGLVSKPNYFSIDRGNIDWENASGTKPTIRDIVNKLAQSQTQREFIVCPRGKGFIKGFSGISFTGNRYRGNEVRRQQSPSNVMMETRTEKSGKYMGQKLRASSQGAEKTAPCRTGLPNIRHKGKSDARNNRQLENLYAIGMSLKSMQSGANRKESLLLPLGTVSALDGGATASQQAKFV